MSFEKIDLSKCLYHIDLTLDQVRLLYNSLRFYHASQLRFSEFFIEGKYLDSDEVMDLINLTFNAVYVTEPKRHHFDFNFDQISLIDRILRFYGDFCFCVGEEELKLDCVIESEAVDELIDLFLNSPFTAPSCANYNDD